MTGLGRHYTLFSLQKDFFYFYKASATNITNLSDHSFTIIPSLSYSWHDDLTIELSANLFFGDLQSDFGAFKQVLVEKVKGSFLNNSLGPPSPQSQAS